MIQIEQGYYSNINIQDVYNIIDIYNYSFKEEMVSSHNNCLCNKYFNYKKSFVMTQKIENTSLYLLNHFEKINKSKILIDDIYLKFTKIKWISDYVLKYSGNNKNFDIWNKYDFIGYNDTHVIVCYIKPQFNELNYNDVLVDSIYDTYFLYNIDKKFIEKEVITCVISLDMDKPYYIDWKDNIKKNESVILNILYENMVEKYNLENGRIYKFYTYWKEFCPEEFKKNPKNFIRFLIKKLETDSGNILLTYIRDFFKNIERQIEDPEKKDKRKKILKNLDDKDFFCESLKIELEKSVENYLNMIVIYDESDDENV
jgi:hypothetical protein